MRPSAFPFIDSGRCKPYIAQGTKSKRRQEVQKGEGESHHQEDSFGTGLLPCFGSVGLIKDVSAWAELSCNSSALLHPVVCCSKFLLSRDKNQVTETNWPEKSIAEFHFLFMSSILPSLILQFTFQLSNLPLSLCACDFYPPLPFLEEQILLQTHSFSLLFIYQFFFLILIICQ